LGVITYRLAPRQGASKVLVFESEQTENLPGEWRARETYAQISDDEFTETFELAPPVERPRFVADRRHGPRALRR
jgi:hypothetical protein